MHKRLLLRLVEGVDKVVVAALLDRLEEDSAKLLHIVLDEALLGVPLEAPYESFGVGVTEVGFLHASEEELELIGNAVDGIGMLLRVVAPLE